MQSLQRKYWNALSGEYQSVMRISTADFHYGPQIPGDSCLKLLPPLSKVVNALELGCGGGQNSVFLARNGVDCLALDISATQLDYARRLANAEHVDVSFICSPIEKFVETIAATGYAPPDGFDLIHSSHAFEFLDDPGGVVKQCADALAPDGMLLISTVHPLYNGDWVDNFDEEGHPCGMGLFIPNYFSPPDDTRYDEQGRIEVISRAWPVSSWFNWFRKAGLEVIALCEPAEQKSGTPPYTSEDWANNEGELAAIPGTLIIGGRKRV